MFGSIGMPELIIIFVIALIIFGPRKLPELGKSLGRSLNEFKKASNDLQNTLEQEIKLEEQKETASRKTEAVPPMTPDTSAPSQTVSRERSVWRWCRSPSGTRNRRSRTRPNRPRFPRHSATRRRRSMGA